ncbi:MAG TPA: DHH family phosphoesterase [Methanosarcinales archaeon]|nr:DHH family phosphoesterase [Methanosarcinales archaeon]
MNKSMKERAETCAAAIRKHEEVRIVSHIDADGLTAAAIMCRVLEQLGIEHGVRFVKQLDRGVLDEVADANIPTIFTDLGSGMLSDMPGGMDVIIADHHQIDQNGSVEYHLNPHLFGIDGSTELSGSGCSYLLAQALGSPGLEPGDLSDLAIVGAVGDLQARKFGKLVGCNREILKQGRDRGVLNYKKDLSFFGKQTREIFKLLLYSSDPYLPGLTGNEDASIEFLRKAGIDAGGERWRRWIDLSVEEQQRMVSSLVQYCISKRMSSYHVHRLVTEVYLLTEEQEGTELRDTSEYSTLLNATARYGFADVGLAVCLGDREGKLAEAHELLADHRRNLVEGLKLVRERGITELSHVQYFDAGSSIRDTIVGIVAGMSLTNSRNRNMPIFAFAESDAGLKVSARGTQALIRKGLNLADAIGACAARVGGTGGGHNIAAGATIPRKSKDEFLELMDTAIGEQLRIAGK